MRSVFHAVLAALLVSGAVGAAQAAGFQNYFQQSAAALGQAGAVVARGSDPSAIFYNPAAICGLGGTQFHLTVDGVNPQSIYTPSTEAGAPLHPSEADMVSGVLPVPAFHATRQMGERLTVGFGVNTPYGSQTEWPENWSGRYYAQFTRLRSAYLAPTAAYRVGERLSFGASVLAVWGQAVVERAINAPLIFGAASGQPEFAGGAFMPANDVRARLAGDDWGLGARIGLQWELGDSWAVGASYQSRVGLDLTGQATYTLPVYQDEDFGRAPMTGETANLLSGMLFNDSDISTRLELPATVAAGVSCAPSDPLTLEVDLTWTGWSSYRDVTIAYENLLGRGEGSAVTPKNWKDVLAVRLGAECALDPRWVARAGYAFDPSPVPDATRDPSLPCSDRHDLALGVGYRTPRWGVDASYLRVLGVDSVSRLNDPASGDLAGRYSLSAHVFALAGTVRF